MRIPIGESLLVIFRESSFAPSATFLPLAACTKLNSLLASMYIFLMDNELYESRDMNQQSDNAKEARLNRGKRSDVY